MISGLGSMKEDSFKKERTNIHERAETLRGIKSALNLAFRNSLAFKKKSYFFKGRKQVYLF